MFNYCSIQSGVVVLSVQDAIFASTMSPHPISRQEKFAEATALWLFASLVSIPLVDAVYVAPFCLLATPRFEQVGFCFLWAPFLMTLEHMHEKRDISSFVAHYWPGPLIATACTVLFLWRWWRRD